MRRSVLLLLIAIPLALAGCDGDGAELSDRDRREAVDNLANSVVTQRGVPGIAVAVIRYGEPFQTLTSGFSDLAAREPVSSATSFQLASTTKIFGSTAVLLLVADGKVGLDDAIGDYLAGLPAEWRGVTVRQLLSHTSGLPDISVETGDVDLVAEEWESAFRIVADRPFQFRPGRGWAYNQTNYALLLRLVEQVSGTSFEDFMQRRLFDPLAMRHTFFPGPQRRCAVNYKREPNGRIVERPELTFPHYVHAAGGLCSSLDDLIAWNAALESGKVVPPDLLNQAWSPAKLADGSNASVAGPMSYGLGWAVDTTSGQRWAGHSGGNSTAFRRYLDDRLTVIVLHNGASDPDAIAGSIARSMLQQTAASGAQDALWDAAGKGDQTAVEAALVAGADVTALDTRSSRNGRFALNWAAIADHPGIIRLLLAKGAAIDARNLSGFTALHHAAEAGSTEAAQTLLAAGANPSLRNAGSETPADVARREGHTAIAEMIDKARGKAG